MKGVTSITSHPCYSLSKPKTQRFLQVRSQSLKDEGSPSNIVDANLGVLRARMEQVMKNEKFEEYTTPKTIKHIEWNQNCNSTECNNYVIQDKNGHATMLLGTVEVVGLVGGSISIVFLFGSLMIFLVSALVHLYS